MTEKKKCEYCDDKFHPQSLNRHKQTFHEDKLPFECPTCGDGFEEKSSVHHHHALSHGEIISKEDRECDICGDIFSEWKYRGTKTCGDEECIAQMRSDMYKGNGNPRWLGDELEVECSYCGEITRKKNNIQEKYDKTFCDLDCYSAWQSENRIGKEHPSWKGGAIVPFGSEWDRSKKNTRKRDDYKCVTCGIEEGKYREEYGTNLHVHHIIPRREFYNEETGVIDEKANRLSNLVTLCAKCHRKAEVGEITERELKEMY